MTNKTKIAISILGVCILIGIIYGISASSNTVNNSSNTKNLYSEQNIVNNNPYNSAFSNYDIGFAEEANYNMYITELAQQKLLNQKIYVEIKSIQKINEVDKSSSTKKETEYSFLLEDYDGNNWITISNRDLQDNSYNIKIKNDLICYGKYLGVIDYNNNKLPQLDISYIYKNLDKLEKSTYIEIGNNYINNLNNKNSKETFEFKEFKQDTGYNTLCYENKTNNLSINLIIDNLKIKGAYFSINDIKSNIDTIDKNLLISFLICFDENITIDNSTTYLDGASNKQKEFKSKGFNKDYKFEPYELNGIILENNLSNTSLTLYYKN